MSELLEMADADDKERWEELALNYTETLGAPYLLELIYQKYVGMWNATNEGRCKD